MPEVSGVGDDEPGAAGALLWEAVRAFSDVDLQRTQRSIRQYHSGVEAGSLAATTAGGTTSTSTTSTIEVHLGKEVQRVRVDDFVHVFTDYLHHQVQLHADVRLSSGSMEATADANRNDSSTRSGNMATFEADAPFELRANEFPQLAPRSNAVVKRDATANSAAATTKRSVKPAKRRITTTLLTSSDSTAVARPVPSAIAFPPLSGPESTRPPAWTKLERRMGTVTAGPGATPSAWGSASTSKKKTPWPGAQAEAATPLPTKSLPHSQLVAMRIKPKTSTVDALLHLQPQVKKALSNQTTAWQQDTQHNGELHECPEKDEPEQESRGEELPIETGSEPEGASTASSVDFLVNRQAAKLFGFLIKERFVSSTCTELQVLVSLLFRGDCMINHRNGSETTSKTDNNATEGALSPCEAASEFCWRVHCLSFAELVFHEIEAVLAHLGTDLLRLVKQSLRNAGGICTALLGRLEQVSQRREELRVAESARIGCRLPIEMKASAVQNFALPFCEETDSRLHYRTAADSFLYSNREKVRDGFLDLLRQFQQKQHSLVGIENAGVAAAAIASARTLLTEVSPENRWWFAKFFVLELVQVGSNPFGESDKDLVLKIMEDKLVVKNPDRLRKLHRRFSSQKSSNRTHQQPGPVTSSNSNRKTGSNKGNSSSLRKDRPDSSEDDATKNFTATFDRMRGYFADNQLFFFHFLHSCDSYEFSQLVKHQLERQFSVIRQATSPSTDARKAFTEVVLKLKVVAKFLGYLRFSPQWHVTSSTRRFSTQNAAFKAEEREGTGTLEIAARDSSLDVKQLLEQSIVRASISKCIPWLCDYLSMLSLDQLSSGTTYFKQLMMLLQLLYRSPRLNCLGETGLYIAMQIERVFHVLELDVGFLQSSEYQARDLLPSPQIRLALAGDDEVASGAGEDHLPFLYSQVFVQSCLSELDDLRGFIQTHAQPSHRLANSRRVVGGATGLAIRRPTTAIRKLRPLQVVMEEDHGVDDRHEGSIHATTKMNTVEFPPTRPEEEEDKLSEAVFKVHPKLKTVVEFVVGTVTTDICEHVMTHVVISRADALVDRCALESGLLVLGRNATARMQDEAVVAAARASFHMLMASRTRAEVKAAAVAALQEACLLAEQRVSVALPAFMPPTSHPTLTQSIVFVALQRTRGAIKTLVPKSSQTEFVKRVAFRNKSLLKDTGSASKAVASPVAASQKSDANAVSTLSIVSDGGVSQEEGLYQALKRYSAEISRHSGRGGSDSSAHEEWGLQATALARWLSQFTNALKKLAVARGVSEEAASPSSVVLLPLWDVAWRAVLSSLRFSSGSLETFVTCRLLSMGEKSVRSTERQFTEFTENFTALLEAIGLFFQAPGRRDSALGADRLRSMTTFVMDCVMTLPAAVAAPEHEELIKRFVVPASSRVTRRLRAVTASGAGDDRRPIEMSRSHWLAARDGYASETARSTQLQFRRDVWDAVESSC
ncbi:hypothetical protein BBJ28_00011013 [Nothophytophthora sp. Chile5]|nr:hypothetical protein BBJ28_00011013 [Nothophytophthora sp. Chile5]